MLLEEVVEETQDFLCVFEVKRFRRVVGFQEALDLHLQGNVVVEGEPPSPFFGERVSGGRRLSITDLLHRKRVRDVLMQSAGLPSEAQVFSSKRRLWVVERFPERSTFSSPR